jgi:hypothetical protein
MISSDGFNDRRNNQLQRDCGRDAHAATERALLGPQLSELSSRRSWASSAHVAAERAMPARAKAVSLSCVQPVFGIGDSLSFVGCFPSNGLMIRSLTWKKLLASDRSAKKIAPVKCVYDSAQRAARNMRRFFVSRWKALRNARPSESALINI